jgi:hypothetical protein
MTGVGGLVALAILAAPASPECRPSRVPGLPAAADESGFRRLEHRVDVDGDGREDVLRVEDSSGSGGGLRTATLTLGSGETLSAQDSYWYSEILSVHEVPGPLAAPRHRAARMLIEEALFPRICPGPDPSLAWLLRTPRRLDWIDGEPVLPETYAVWREGPRGQEWLWYGGHNHGYARGQGPQAPRELARQGGRVLLGTSHGVILTDPGRGRHAWVYVATPPHKLRFPSVLGARLAGDHAVVTLTRGDGSYVDKGTLEVRVDLTTGVVSEAAAPK